MKRRIALEAKIPVDLRSEVSDKLPYASEKLASFALGEDGASIDVECAEGAFAEVEAKVRKLVAQMTAGHRKVEAEKIWEHRRVSPHRDPIWNELVDGGLLAEEGPGQIALLGDAARVADALDMRFLGIGLDKFAATPHQYPTMLPMTALDRCHYFSSFPHHVTFAPHVREDVEAIAQVATAENHDTGRAFLQHLAPPAHVLSPAVCFHTYALLADRPLERPLTVAAKGRCFRFESKNMTMLERAWDFTMREVIFVGPKDWVDERRQRAIAEVQELVGEMDLDAWIETANDPFFATNFVAKRYHQLMTQAKFELRLMLPYANKSLAAASFNIHGDFFGRSFAIALDNGFVSTGCLAFGVERWVWALFAQLGPRVSAWPMRVRQALALA